MESILVKRQVKKFTAMTVGTSPTGRAESIVCTIRYDDQCGNKHNSFSITGEIIDNFGRCQNCGCIHEEIEKYFPELAKYIKWHFMNSDGPMHYIGNSMYHAKIREDMNLPLRAVTGVKKKLKFKGYPFTFNQQEPGFWAYMDSVGDFNNIEVEEVKYDGKDTYDFSPNYSLTGFIKENEVKKWYKAPFKTKNKAEEFLEALKTVEYEIIEMPIKWNKAVVPNLEGARNCAIWPDAELEDFTEDKLKERLPALIEEFKKALKELKLVY